MDSAISSLRMVGPDSPKGTPKDGIIIGGYNGDLSNAYYNSCEYSTD